MMQIALYIFSSYKISHPDRFCVCMYRNGSPGPEYDRILD